MTNFELNQNPSVIIEAGGIAFSIGVPLAGNPYRKNANFFKLWGAGHKRAKNTDNKNRDFKGRYKVYFEPIVSKPMCVKCSIPVLNTYCSKCGDEYLATEMEEM